MPGMLVNTCGFPVQLLRFKVLLSFIAWVLSVSCKNWYSTSYKFSHSPCAPYCIHENNDVLTYYSDIHLHFLKLVCQEINSGTTNIILLIKVTLF